MTTPAPLSSLSNASDPELRPMLTTLRKVEELRANSDSVVRRGNIDAFLTKTDDGARTEVGICHLPVLLGFSWAKSGKPWNLSGTYESVAAAALAVQHLNSGDGSVSPEVGGLDRTCPLRFTLESVDTELVESRAVERVIGLTDRSPGDPVSPLPCALIGATRSAVSMPTSIVSGLRGYPQISPSSLSSSLDDPTQYPLFARTVPSDGGMAASVILYLRHRLGVRHLAVVHIDENYGNGLANGLRVAAEMHAPDMDIVTFDMPYDHTPEVVERTVRVLRDTEFMYFYSALFGYQTEAFFLEAHRQGIAGTGRHAWFHSAAASSFIKVSNPPRGSPLHRSLFGTSIITLFGGLDGMPQYDKFAAALRGLRDSDEDMDVLRSKLPPYGHGPFVDRPDFLDSPGLITPYAYDAVIAAGLAACSGSNGTHLDGGDHFDALVRTTFEGATGRVSFDNVTGSREPMSASYYLVNYVEDESGSNDTHVRFREVKADTFRDGGWVNIEDVIFNDGTTDVPPDLPHRQVERNHLPPGMRAGGLAMCAVVLVLSASFAAWTMRRRKARVVTASQPIFLHIICAGAVVMGSAIIPLGVDGGLADETGCDVACASFPWLLSLGFSAIFSALFTKTHRINILLKHACRLRRVKVTVRDVMKPMLTTLAANVLVLGLWTGLDPLRWEMRVVSTDRFHRPTETYGFCSSDNAAPYVATLAVINIGPLAYALYEAFRARNISTEFAESDYIFMSLAGVLLVSFMGIPVLIIARDTPEAFFFVFSAIIFVTCSSVLLLIFVPKIVAFRSGGDNLDISVPRDTLTSSRTFARNSSDLSSSKGVRIISHPKIQESLVLENQRLLEDISKLRETLELMDGEGNGKALVLENRRLLDEIHELKRRFEPEEGWTEEEGGVIDQIPLSNNDVGLTIP